MGEHSRDREKKLLKPHALETEEEDDSNAGIDTTLLEKRLEGLRDTQESVQGLSLWCQTNKRHSSVIIEAWLRILRKSPVEKRLTLFYLANDVIQHAKKKNDMTVVNQWAFAVQKATPHVRTPSSVSAAISRIFKIWEERSIYSKDAIADLLSLLNNVPAKDRVVENNKPETYTAPAEKVSAFQPSSLISKVKMAYRLKSHLGVTFRSKRYVDMDMESFKTMIKDRTQGLEVIQEISQYLDQLKASEAKLSAEVEERRKIVETAEIALVFYENVRGEAKIVNAAYKNFTTRVTNTKEKVDEKIKAFDEMEGTISPVPSPPAVAPSPPLDEEEFGVRPANKCGGTYTTSNLPSAAATYIEVIQNNTKEFPVSNESTAATNIDSHTPDLKAPYTPTMGQHSNPVVSQFESNQMNQYQSIASIQQFQQAWSTTAMADTYATMSMSMPNLNFIQQFQQPSMPIMSTGYGVSLPTLQAPYGSLGYETYQQPQGEHQTSPPLPPPPDVSAIPLPPGPNPVPPQPPPLPQEAPPDHTNMYVPSQPPPPPGNPFEVEYDPTFTQHQQQPQSHSNFSEPTGYDPSVHAYNAQPASSTDTPSSRYHPYNNQSPRGRRLSGPHRSQGQLNSNNNHSATNRYSNNTSPTLSHIPPLTPELSSMERFSQSLSKSRNSIVNNNPIPQSPTSSNAEWSSPDKDDIISQSNFVQSHSNPYFPGNSYNEFDDSQNQMSQDGLNGNEGGSGMEQYIPQQTGNIFDTSPQLMNRGNNRGHINPGRGNRGMKHLMNSRGHPPRGGLSRGGLQNSRGFPGFRGARGGGMVRGAGPPRGRARF